MKTAIIIHGMPSKEDYFNPKGDSQSNCHWLPWIQKQLTDRSILAQTPEMPEPYEPNYQKWKSVFEQFRINEETILIGHSCGGGFLVRWLSENNVKVGKVFLVAPWIGFDPNDAWTKLTGDFFIFDIDSELVKKTNGVTIFVSSDDDKEILTVADVLKKNIKGCLVQEFSDKGHFTYGDMRTREFPELLQEIVQ
jgi:predicted alpha/beta hydrolase family esterase